ncbi:hexosaminidase D isoform X2 [Genypterus blacodes]|uniref:hexosaminidase D isoform X2 n=1 Tax=Genypterus blacodes TaxID=154954 RepID=UPI003F76D646
MSPPWPNGRKLVHLDLKGAPPRIEYLHQLMALFSELGADGLLMEYEDVFPYEGELRLLQATAQPAYSPEEVLSIQEVARSRGLEFVLKQESLRELRELDHCVGTLNPHRAEGLQLLMKMLRQVVDLHPDLHTLHIGADEVYLLGEGEESKQWLASPGRTVEQLFLSHVTKLAKAIKEAWPHMNIIMWDDMMRGMSPDTLRASGLVGLVQPMLWDYGPALDVDTTVSLLEKYSSAGLSELWAATSFKGSTHVHTTVTKTQRHVDNHLQWLKVAAGVSPGVKLLGVALTGWQRYDHLSVLCELMPVALPSLASCLETLVCGQFGGEAQSRVMQRLSVSSVEVEDLESSGASAGDPFVGRRLAEIIVELTSTLNSEDVCGFENSMCVRGWLSPYHRQRKRVSPLIAMQIHSQATTYLTALEQKVEALWEEMRRLYPDSVVQEWIEQHVVPVTAPLQRVTEDIRVCLEEMLPQKDPSPSPAAPTERPSVGDE